MNRAFTLIELLIVVAIIAILAAIAVPNMLEAQSRAKVSRALADMRSVATALEAYAADNTKYPPHGEILANGTDNFPAVAAGLTTIEYLPGAPLTTPIAYISSAPRDISLRSALYPALERFGYIDTLTMAGIMRSKGLGATAERLMPRYGGWRLFAAGPDGDKGPDAKQNVFYDPTNGTVSNGDIVRSQRSPRETVSEDE